MSRFCSLLLGLVLLCPPLLPSAAVAAAESGFTILYSNSLNGETDPCG